MAVFPIVMSGGKGSRLWPLSRAMYPKQFLSLLSDRSDTLLEMTLKRLPTDLGYEAPTVLCNSDHRFLVAEAARATQIDDLKIILEPVARNTAPAIAVAAHAALQQADDAVLVVMPSDHVVRDEAAFRDTVGQAVDLARTGCSVLLGIKPDTPHTGYGYIKAGAPLECSGEAYDVAAFAEKPDANTAAAYLADGSYYWNSGIFILHAKTFLDELKRLEPKIEEATKSAWALARTDLQFLRLDEESFSASPSISVDYAVMEKTRSARVIPVDMGWSDIGSWGSLQDIEAGDEDGNVVAGHAAEPGRTVLIDTKNSYVHSSRSLVATVGLENVVIVETPDAILLADKARSQDVGAIVDRLSEQGSQLHEQHLRNHRPWGFFEQLNVGDRFQVKLLHVNPGAQLSLQMHHHRSEHWVVVKGTALVTIDDKEQYVHENESVFIVATQWHQLANPGKVPLELIEVQLGAYLGEDDIIRKNDIYHRADHETK